MKHIMQKFDSGAIRKNADGKGRLDLLPVHGLFRLGIHYENGAKDHGDRNFEKGMPQSRYIQSMFRHLIQYIGGDRSEDHLAAFVWGGMGLMELEELVDRGLMPKKYLDNRVLLDDKGKQCIPLSVFLPDEFKEGKIYNEYKREQSKKPVPRKTRKPKLSGSDRKSSNRKSKSKIATKYKK